MEYLIIKIENIEPLKIGSQGNKENQKEPTLDYIPGNSLRGSVINQFLKNNKIEEGKKNEEELFKILTDVYFYNAYPSKENKLFVPTPLNIRMDKHKWRSKKASKEKTVEVKILESDNTESNFPCKNNLEHKYLNFSSKILEGFKVEKTYRLHHSTKKNLEHKYLKFSPKVLEGFKVERTYRLHHSTKKKLSEDVVKKESKDRDNLFRYEAIDSGHTFLSIIASENIDIMNRIESSIRKNSTLYIGGSKTSGYGKCSIEIINEFDFEKFVNCYGKNYNNTTQTNSSNILTFTCLSNCLFRNKFGMNLNHIPDDILEKYFGEIKRKAAYVNAVVTEGYNAKWKARLPKETAIKAGSVFVYELNTVPNDLKERIKKFESKLHGEKNVEGYGWISVNLLEGEKKLECKIQSDYKSWKKNEPDNTSVIQKSSNIAIIISGLQQFKTEWLRTIAYSEIENSEHIVCNLKKNQMQNLIKILDDRLNSDNYDEKKENLRDYARDNKKFSFCGLNFQKILTYEGCNNYKTQLREYAEKQLGTADGNKIGTLNARIYYELEGQQQAVYDEKYKLFIQELLKEILYVKRRLA